MDKWLDTDEAAARLQTTRHALYKRVQRGRLRAFVDPQTKRLLFRVKDLALRPVPYVPRGR